MRPQFVQHPPLKPNQAIPVLVDLVLKADIVERQRPGDRLEGGLADGDADHLSAALFRRPIALASIKASCSPRPACLPIRIVTLSVVVGRSSHCSAKLSISRSSSRNSPVKSLTCLTQTARSSAKAPLVMHCRTTRAAGDAPSVCGPRQHAPERRAHGDCHSTPGRCLPRACSGAMRAAGRGERI